MVLTDLSDHIGVLLYLLTIIFSAFASSLGWFITRTLAKIDQNQTKLFDMVGALASQLAAIQAQHDMLVRHFYDRKKGE